MIKIYIFPTSFELFIHIIMMQYSKKITGKTYHI